MHDTSSLERIVPEQLRADESTGAKTLELHLARYEFAKTRVIPGTILDLACGVGYGTALLASSASIKHATGVDISSEAITYALATYSHEKTTFICSSALEFTPKAEFDNIVSLETIEHVDDPLALFSHLVTLLRPGGRLIASVPITPSVDANPHHKSNFSEASFRTLGNSCGLQSLEDFRQVQTFNPFALLSRREHRAKDLRSNILGFYAKHPTHLMLRVAAVLKNGFTNKYLTIVWAKPD